MRTNTRAAALCVMAGAAMSGATAAYGVDLSYKWQEGVTLQYEIVSDVTQETASPFGNSSFQLTTTSVQSMEVVGVRRGDGEIEVTADSIKVELDNGMGMRFTYDSENPRDRRLARDPTIAPYAAIVGETFTMTLNEAGEVQNLKDQAQFVQLSGMTDAMFEAQLEQMWNIVPGDDVEIGETWSTRVTQAVPGVGDITIELEYTFVEMDSMEGLDVAVIEVKGEASLGRGTRVQGMRVEITESTIEGVIHFAPDLGLVIESEQATDMLIEVSGQGQSIAQSVSSSVFMELIDMQGLELEAPEEVEDAEAEPASRPASRPAPSPAPEPAAPPAAPGGGRGGKP